MRIIMLAGEGGTGKTTTLKMVYDRLSNNIKPMYYQEFIYKTSSDIECYPLYHHDKKVALCTEGDVWDHVKNTIIKFNCIGADVLIIAFNQSDIGAEAKNDSDKKADMQLFTPDVLKDIYPHCVIQKRISPNPNDPNANEENNEKDCQAIIDRI